MSEFMKSVCVGMLVLPFICAVVAGISIATITLFGPQFLCVPFVFVPGIIFIAWMLGDFIRYP